MPKFRVVVSTSSVYTTEQPTQQAAIEEVMRFQHLGWTEDVKQLGDGPTSYAIEEVAP